MGQNDQRYKWSWGSLGVDFGALARTPLWAAKSGLCFGGYEPLDRPRGRRLRGAPGRSGLGSQILLFNLWAQDKVSTWGAQIGPSLGEVGLDLGPKVA